MWVIFGRTWMVGVGRAGGGVSDLLLWAMAAGALVVPVLAVVEWAVR